MDVVLSSLVGIRHSLVSEGFSNLNNAGILCETLEVAPATPLGAVPEFRHPSRVVLQWLEHPGPAQSFQGTGNGSAQGTEREATLFYSSFVVYSRNEPMS